MTAKIVAKQAFTTTDGQNFFDLGEAQTHQAHLDNKNVIEAYLAKNNVGKAQAGMLRNTLPAFIAFKAEVDAGLNIDAWLPKEAEKTEGAAEAGAPAAEASAEASAGAAEGQA